MFSTSGIVRLESGLWHWVARERAHEISVHFSQSDSPSDEMFVWVHPVEMDITDIAAIAAEAAIRRWKDGFGQEWEICVEHCRADSIGDDAAERILYFTSGRRGHRIPAPAGKRLCDLRGSTLTHLIARAERLDDRLAS